MADIFTMLSEYVRDNYTDEGLKKKAFGIANPTTEQMQEVAEKMAEKYFPETEMTSESSNVLNKKLTPQTEKLAASDKIDSTDTDKISVYFSAVKKLLQDLKDKKYQYPQNGKSYLPHTQIQK